MSNYFSKEPIITWTKVLCPLCGEPTGRKSNCHNMPPAKMIPIYKRNMVNPNTGILPVFSENCAFKQNNLWTAEINYPVSEPLLTRLKSIDGINHIEPSTPHGFQVAIAHSYHEEEIKFQITQEFYLFIREMNSLEESELSLNEICGIKFPNTNTFEIDNNLTDDEKSEQIDYLNEIVFLIPGCSVYNKEQGE